MGRKYYCSVAGQGADERVRAGSSEGARGDPPFEIGSKPGTGSYKRVTLFNIVRKVGCISLNDIV